MERMPEHQHDDGAPAATEIVGRFADRDRFTAAVERLIGEGGFERSDLSVLDSHQSLGAAGAGPDESWRARMAAMVGEAVYLGPITVAGLIMLAAGPVGAALAGTIGAGLTGLALKEMTDEIAAGPHREAFARALAEGAVLLWVRADTPDRQDLAMRLMATEGGVDIHPVRRVPRREAS